MPIPIPSLDDRSFQDIVDEAKRLIPRYCPEWTNHNVADPGVALIELFAWMTEMAIFRLNQVPDRLYLHFLNMIGIELFPPSVARGDLLFELSAVLDRAVVIPSGTEVATAGPTVSSPVVFSTTDELVVRPPSFISAKTGLANNDELFVDVFDELRFDGGEVRCFASDPIEPGDAVYLGFAESLSGHLIRLSISASIEGIGVDPRNAPIVWETFVGDTWLPVEVRSDTTGGLNRDGSVVVIVPRGTTPLILGGTRAFWLRARLVEPREGQPFYKATPRISALQAEALGGIVAAEQSSAGPREILGSSTGQPGQSFELSQAPVLVPKGRDAGRLTVGTDTVPWEKVEDFSASGPGDRHYVLHGSSGLIEFGPIVRYGDGSARQHGMIPPDGAEIAIEGCRFGGGAAGNVGSGTLTVLRSSVPFVDSVTNPEPATGGVDGETIENAKLRGPLSLRTGERAVTIRDFERLTFEATPEVARVRCLAPSSGGDPVRLLVVPTVVKPHDELVIDDFALSDALVADVSSYLEPRRLLGSTVEIGTPYYQGVTVAVLLHALPGRPVSLIRQRCLDLLHHRINPLSGGPNGTGWPFSVDLSTAHLTELLEGVEGVDRIEEIILFEYDLRTGMRSGPGSEIIRLDADSLFLSARHQVVVR